MLHKILIFFVFSLIVQVSPSHADRHTEKLKDMAQKYYWGKEVKRDYAKALKLYTEAASLGDTEAQYIAGGMYYKGLGTNKNLNYAFSLLHGAAIKGNSTPESQKILGQFFLTGKSIPRNYAEALKWYTLSAENGDRESQAELAFLYYTGLGVNRDFEKAFLWYERSAMQGLAVSQYSLGVMYYSGNGVKKTDVVKAYAWLSLSAAQNHMDAVSARDYVETTMSPGELKESQEYALKLFEQIKS